MKTLAVVPVKSLREAKSRLSSALSSQERANLTHDLLDHVLDVISASGAVDGVGVISPDFYALSLPLWVTPIEQTQQGLNSLLEHGRQWAVQDGADAIIVIFADLPLLTPEDIRSILELGVRRNTIVLAPDRHGEGTNAMLAHPVELAHFAYGPYSFQKHQAAAHEVGAQVELYSSPGVSLDIDTPDDLGLLRGTPFVEAQYAVGRGMARHAPTGKT